VAAASCCVDAGPEAGPPDAGIGDAGSDLEGGGSADP
jgi:hypothetical protein